LAAKNKSEETAKTRASSRQKAITIGSGQGGTRPDFDSAAGGPVAGAGQTAGAEPPRREPRSRPGHHRNLIAGYRDKEGKHKYVMHPGDTVVLTTVSGGEKMLPVSIASSYRLLQSRDERVRQHCVFVERCYLQNLRTMQNRVSALQIQTQGLRRGEEVVAALREMFASRTLKCTQGGEAGLAAVAIEIEKGILMCCSLHHRRGRLRHLAIFSMNRGQEDARRGNPQARVRRTSVCCRYF